MPIASSKSSQKKPIYQEIMKCLFAYCHSISTERLPVRHRTRNQVPGLSNLISRDVGLSWIFWFWSSGCLRKPTSRGLLDTMRKSFLDSKLPFLSHRHHQVISRGYFCLWSEARVMDDAQCSSISSTKRVFSPRVLLKLDGSRWPGVLMAREPNAISKLNARNIIEP